MGPISAVRGLAHVAAIFFLILSLPLPGAGQPENGGFVGGGVGLGMGSMSVASSSHAEFGVVLFGELGIASSGYRKWVVDVTAELFEIPSPVMEEAYQAITGMVRYSFGSELFVAPGIGVQYRSWSGRERVEASDKGLAVGVNIGASRRINETLVLLPEISWMFSEIEMEGSVDASLISVRFALVRMRR